MRNYVHVATSLFAIGFTCCQVGADEPRRHVQVTARSQVKAPPDEVLTAFAIATEDKDLLKAKAANDQRTKAVLELAARHKIPEGDVKITDLTVQPEFDQVQGKKTFINYSFTRSCEVTLRDFAKLEPFLADLLGSGVDYVNQVQFRLGDQAKALGEARQQAVRYAKEKATNLAALNDMKLGKAITIYEHEQENESAGGLGGMADARKAGRGEISLAIAHTGTSRADRTDTRVLVRLQRASFLSGGRLALIGAAQPEGVPRRDPLLAPGQVTIRARVTITFELLP